MSRGLGRLLEHVGKVNPLELQIECDHYHGSDERHPENGERRLMAVLKLIKFFRQFKKIVCHVLFLIFTRAYAALPIYYHSTFYIKCQ